MLFLHVSSNCNQFLAILEKTNFVSILSAHLGADQTQVGRWNDNKIGFSSITKKVRVRADMYLKATSLTI